MDYIISHQLIKSKKEYLDKLFDYTRKQFKDSKDKNPIADIIKSEVQKIDDGIISQIVQKKLKVEPRSKQTLATEELVTWKVQIKQQYLEESLKTMLADAVISKHDYNRKL